MLMFGVALALASAFITNLGFRLRRRGAVAAPAVDERHPWRSALTGGGDTGQRSADHSLVAMLAFECALVGLGTALILFHRANRSLSRHGVPLGVAAGLLFTVTHVAVKAITGEADEDLGGGARVRTRRRHRTVAAFFASARSLQNGDAVPVIALTSIASNASAIPAGIVVFSDSIGDDPMSVVLRSLAFALVVLAAAMIPAPTRAAGSTRSAAHAVPSARVDAAWRCQSQPAGLRAEASFTDTGSSSRPPASCCCAMRSNAARICC
jgi:hypothetical protein